MSEKINWENEKMMKSGKEVFTFLVKMHGDLSCGRHKEVMGMLYA